MNRKTIVSIGSALVALGVMSVAGYGCGDDDTATPTKDSGTVITPEAGPGADTGPGSDTGTKNPAPPTLGAQIDRLGRPAINTALTGTFDPNPTTKGAKKDAYNQDNAQSGWNPKYIPEQAGNLAVFDSLDTKCGNQFLAQDAGAAGGPNTAVYGALAGITADDRLWLNTARRTSPSRRTSRRPTGSSRRASRTTTAAVARSPSTSSTPRTRSSPPARPASRARSARSPTASTPIRSRPQRRRSRISRPRPSK
jgi:hypothetical protein